MAKVQDGLKYAKTDEWVRLEGDTATIGLSDYAQEQLNDIVYVELPGVGDKLNAGSALGIVESVKAASDVYTPLTGEVIAINDELEGSPDLINSDAFGKGWLIKLKVTDTAPLDALMDSAAYQQYCETREH